MNIKISPKHGLNPSILQCVLCGRETGVGLLGKLPSDEQAPRHMPDRSPCDDCADAMKQGGVLLVEATKDDEGRTVLTGRSWVITDEAAARIFNVKARAAYIEQGLAEKLGLTER